MKLKFLYGLHVEAGHGRDHFAKLQLIEYRGLSSCHHQDPHHGLATLITRVPEHDAMVVKISLADMHTTCNVRALRVDALQFTKTSISAAVQTCEQPSIRLVLLSVLVTVTLGRLGIFSNGL